MINLWHLWYINQFELLTTRENIRTHIPVATIQTEQKKEKSI